MLECFSNLQGASLNFGDFSSEYKWGNAKTCSSLFFHFFLVPAECLTRAATPFQFVLGRSKTLKIEDFRQTDGEIGCTPRSRSLNAFSEKRPKFC